MWRAARQEDLGKIESFLYRHVQSSMFPLANLRNFGLNGSDPRAVRMWVIGDDPRAVFTITNEGMILPQCPDCTDHELLSALALIGDGLVADVIGEAAQARPIVRLAGWQDKAAMAVALHLNEARESGVTHAILFAASESAARAYMAIGFAPAGKFALILFQAKKEVTA